VFCKSDNLKPKGGTPICLYNDIWHVFHPNIGDPYLEIALPSVHNYNINMPPAERTQLAEETLADTNNKCPSTPEQSHHSSQASSCTPTPDPIDI
jgi:hypothetical protein